MNNLRSIVTFALIFLAAPFIGAQDISEKMVVWANNVYEERGFDSAFELLSDVELAEDDTKSRLVFADAITAIGNKEYAKKNYLNAYECFRTALKIQFSNRTATAMYLKMRQEMDVNNLSNYETGSDEEISATTSEEVTVTNELLLKSEGPVHVFNSNDLAKVIDDSILSDYAGKIDVLQNQLEKIIVSQESVSTAILDETDKEAMNEILGLLSDISDLQQNPKQEDLQQITRLESTVQALGQNLDQMNESFPTSSVVALLPWVGGIQAFIGLVIVLFMLKISKGKQELYSNARRIHTTPTSAMQHVANPKRSILDSPKPDRNNLLGSLYQDKKELSDLPVLKIRSILSIPQKLKPALAGQDRSIITAKFARTVAKKIGLSHQECQNLYLGSLIHDAGYLMLDAGQLVRIIKRPAMLDPKERSFIQLHPLLGPHYFSGFAIPSFLKNAMLFHHERLDGSGYPLGLAGDEIPLNAQIIGICETVVALIGTRAYRNRFDISEALDIVNHERNVKFSGELVDAVTSVAKTSLTNDDYK